jgi:hypothetical protein
MYKWMETQKLLGSMSKEACVVEMVEIERWEEKKMEEIERNWIKT